MKTDSWQYETIVNISDRGLFKSEIPDRNDESIMMHEQPSSRRKVAIIGAGYVGASIAYALTIKDIAQDIVLIDIDKEKAEAEALDIQHGIPFMGACNVYIGDYSDCAGCDLIIVTAGRNRRPDETRLNMTNDNILIMKDVITNLSRFYTRGVILIISNPVDILVYFCSKLMDMPDGMIIGTGCILDTSRLVSIVANYVRLRTDSVNGFIVGEHGDGQIPIWSRLSIRDIPINEYCIANKLPWGTEQKEVIAARVKQLGTEIIRGKGRTHYGIASCVCYLADSIVNKRNTIASVSTTLKGEYGIKDVALSLPSVLGSSGVIKRFEEKWTDFEVAELKESAEKLTGIIKSVNL